MSGSGATCFALFENFDLLQDAKIKLEKIVHLSGVKKVNLFDTIYNVIC